MLACDSNDNTLVASLHKKILCWYNIFILGSCDIFIFNALFKWNCVKVVYYSMKLWFLCFVILLWKI